MSFEHTRSLLHNTVDYFSAKHEGLKLVIGGTTLALVAACSPNSQPAGRTAAESSAASSAPAGTTAVESSSAAPSSSNKASFVLMPNLSGFLKPGTADTCYASGPRPCAILIRILPKISSDIINVSSRQSTAPVTWPRESYQGSPGDPVTATCYTKDGDEVKSYEGGLDSTVWFSVEVPYQDVENPAIKAQLDAANPNVPKDRIVAHGWAAAPWFGLEQPPTGMDKCAA